MTHDPLPPQRHLFDIPPGVAYFNCAYNSPQLGESTARLVAGAQAKRHPWTRTADGFFEDADTVRRLAARALGGEAEGYAVVPSASYGISTAARALEGHLRAGDRILVVAEEFPSNVLPWQRAARESGASVETVARPEDGRWSAAILDAMAALPSLRIVALSTCHWTDGSLIDLVPIARACRERGVVLVVDATQTLGAVPFDFEAVAPDFLVAAGYKWLLAPYGFSLLHVAARWRNARPLEETWLGRENARDFAGLTRYEATYSPGARRFDMGQKCTATLLPGAIAALEQIEAWGVHRVAASLSAVTAAIAARLVSLGWTVPAPSHRCPHLLGARASGELRPDLVPALAARNVFVSRRGTALRFAPHLHVDGADLQQLFTALDDLAEAA